MTKKIMAAALFAVAAMALACPAKAAKGPGPEEKGNARAEAGRLGDADYRITFRVNAEILESSGTVLATLGGKTEAVTRGETAVYAGEDGGKPSYRMRAYDQTAEFSVLPDGRGADSVSLKCRFRLNGPIVLKGGGIEEADLNFYSEVRVSLGKPAVLLDEKGSRVEVLVEAAR